MCISSARRFKALVLVDEAGSQRPRVGLAQLLVRSPASGGEALRGDQHLEGVPRGAQVHFAAKSEIRLHGGVEGVDVAVGMLAGKDVFAGSERLEVGLIVEEANGELLVAVARAALISEEKVFGQRVGLVPVVGDVSFFAGTPAQFA